MRKTLIGIATACLITGSITQTATAQTQPRKDFQKLDISSSEYSATTRSGATTHCVFINLLNQENKSRQLTLDERAALRYNIQLVDMQKQTYQAQLITEENDESPDDFCFERKVALRSPITQCLGMENMSHAGKRSCYLLRFDTPMGVRGSHLQLEPLHGQPILIRL